MNINFLGVGLGGISKIAPHDTQGLQRAFVLTKRSKDFRREIVLLQIIYRNRYGQLRYSALHAWHSIPRIGHMLERRPSLVMFFTFGKMITPH